MSQVNVLSIQNLVVLIIKLNNQCKIHKEFHNNPHILICLEIRIAEKKFL